MAKNPPKIVLDTNIIISALGFGGKPRQILFLALEEKIQVVTSPILLAELQEVINKKFPLLKNNLSLLLKEIEDIFINIQPQIILEVVRDEDDNRVLEAAIEGKCDYIITGDKDLLDLEVYKNIKILTPKQFIDIF